MKSIADLSALLRSFFKGERTFNSLSRIPLWRALSVEVLALAILASGYYFLRYLPVTRSRVDSCRQLHQEGKLTECRLEEETAACRALCDIKKQIMSRMSSATKVQAERFFAESPSFQTVDMVSIVPFPEQTVGEYYKKALRITLTSDYVELVKYLRSIETKNPEFNIVELNLSSPDNIYPRIKVNMLVELYGAETPGEAPPNEKKETVAEKRKHEKV
jgi:hypothetical protein